MNARNISEILIHIYIWCFREMSSNTDLTNAAVPGDPDCPWVWMDGWVGGEIGRFQHSTMSDYSLLVLAQVADLTTNLITYCFIFEGQNEPDLADC